MKATWVFAVIAFAPAARAGNQQVDACVDAVDHSQQLRDQGKLLEAREQLLVCGASTCPRPVAKQCDRWLQEVNAELPTLSLRARNGAGVDVTDVTVLVDGTQRLAALDGRPLPIDPGEHHLTVRRGEDVVEQTLMVRAGEKDRLVDVQLGKAPAPVVTEAPPPVTPAPPVVVVEPTRHPFRFPWTAGLFLGLGVASAVGTVVLVAVAGSDAGSLRSTCAPSCPSSDVDAVRAKLIAANVTLGAAIGFTVLSGIILIAVNVGHSERRVSVGVSADHGFGANLGGTF